MITNKDIRYLELARRQALRSRYIKQVGAVFVRGNKILAQGVNRVSHPKFMEFKGIDGYEYFSLHAECDALARVGDVDRSTVYLFGIKNKICKSKPCPLCELYLRKRGVIRAVYTVKNGIEEMSI